jgi:hypothetical protein
MAAVWIFASDIMDDAATFLNDAGKTTYTYAVQIPYLNIALKEMKKHFALANVNITDETSAELRIPAGQDRLEYFQAPSVELPEDLVDIRRAWQRPTGTSQQYTPLSRLDGLPIELEGIEVNYFYGYVWERQMMKFLPATVDIDIKLEYIFNICEPVVAATDEISVNYSDSFLAARTAALLARHVEENIPRADTLDATAGVFLEEVLGISAKGNQSRNTRRRPFRQGYKSRGY